MELLVKSNFPGEWNMIGQREFCLIASRSGVPVFSDWMLDEKHQMWLLGGRIQRKNSHLDTKPSS
jgi:hypothetical protein